MSLREELRMFAAQGGAGPKSTGQMLCERAADELDRCLPVRRQGYARVPSHEECLQMLEEARGYLRSRFGVCLTCRAVAEEEQDVRTVVHDPDCLYMRVERALAKRPGSEL